MCVSVSVSVSVCVWCVCVCVRVRVCVCVSRKTDNIKCMCIIKMSESTDLQSLSALSLLWVIHLRRYIYPHGGLLWKSAIPLVSASPVLCWASPCASLLPAPPRIVHLTPLFNENPHAGTDRFTIKNHDDVIKLKHFPRYWPFMREFTGELPAQKASDAECWCFLWPVRG